jgi:hypothetical protein
VIKCLPSKSEALSLTTILVKKKKRKVKKVSRAMGEHGWSVCHDLENQEMLSTGSNLQNEI